MTEYRRVWVHGGTWFFTVNLAQRRGNHPLADNIDLLWAGFARVDLRYPFRQEAFVIIPDRLHCIWTLPYGDTDFSVRWSLIKPNSPMESRNWNGFREAID
jgi:putative transposase